MIQNILLKKILICPKCLKKIHIRDNEIFCKNCKNCKNNYRINNGKYYFIDKINDNIVTKKSNNVTNFNNWTP